MASSKLLLALLLLVLAPATVQVALARQSSASEGLKSVHIVATGTATPIPPDQSTQKVHASIDLTGTIKQKNSPSLIAFTIDSGTLIIGDTTFTVVRGWGIYNLRSLVVEIHAFVQHDGVTRMLILHGLTESALTGAGSTAVHFESPMSKLASEWFLDLSGNITLR